MIGGIVLEGQNWQETTQLVGFKIEKEEYAVDILLVQEIIRPSSITRVPNAPFYIDGVINLRGNVVPVLNLRKRFGLDHTLTSDTNRIIILKIEDISIGLTVDSVTEVLNIPSEQTEKPTLLDGIDSRFVKSVGKIEQRLIIILDLLNLLDIRSLVSDE